ncbi:MAG: DUF309 domain-containing protein [Acidobacteria bacterium]|nr:DUF309 domain-containing protein [Acidobacteriota bacterium]
MTPPKSLFPERAPQPEPYDVNGFRYTTRDFPPYRHLPGVTPHPRLHSRGHQFGKKEVLLEPFNVASWWLSQPYLYGVDLYNFAYFWEAHEAWEEIWRTTERNDLPERFLKGVIQLAAALLKRHQGFSRGMSHLSRRGLDRLRAVAEVHTDYAGVDLADYIRRMQQVFAESDRSGWPTDPRIYLKGLSQKAQGSPC